jgi:hypothetical protein
MQLTVQILLATLPSLIVGIIVFCTRKQKTLDRLGWQPKGPISQEEFYSAAVQLVVHAERISWDRLYYYLVAATVLILAWVQVYSKGTSKDEIVLLLIALFGMLISLWWAPFGSRGRRYLYTFIDYANWLDTQQKGPLSIGRPTAFSILEKGSKSSIILVVLPLIFAWLFSFLALQSIVTHGISWRAMGMLSSVRVTTVMDILWGFLLGILASAIAAVFYEYASRPLLDIVVDTSGRAQGQLGNNPPHEFYHAKVRNLPAKWPLSGRKPAWSTKATIEVFAADGSRAIPDTITARWASQPEPLLPVVYAGQPANLLDPARLVAARKVDVHGHEDQQLPVVVKFERQAECYIFSNESYQFSMWQNPAWRLVIGTYRLRVTVYYERGRSQEDFELRNSGPSRDDVQLRPWRRA